jgi:hypothetical membrane protein
MFNKENDNSVEILLKEYDHLQKNIIHNEQVRDRILSFYLIGFSILLNAVFIFLELKQDYPNYIPHHSDSILFFILYFISFIMICIQSRLRRVINRDGQAKEDIRMYLTSIYPQISPAFLEISKYFKYRWNRDKKDQDEELTPEQEKIKNKINRFHQHLNVNRLVVYLITAISLFCFYMGIYSWKSVYLFSLISLVFPIVMIIVAIWLFEKEFKIPDSNTETNNKY